jgi:hypothetical protein
LILLQKKLGGLEGDVQIAKRLPPFEAWSESIVNDKPGKEKEIRMAN